MTAFYLKTLTMTALLFPQFVFAHLCPEDSREIARCDISGQGRTIRRHLVCQKQDKSQTYKIFEISSSGVHSLFQLDEKDPISGEFIYSPKVTYDVWNQMNYSEALLGHRLSLKIDLAKTNTLHVFKFGAAKTTLGDFGGFSILIFKDQEQKVVKKFFRSFGEFISCLDQPAPAANL